MAAGRPIFFFLISAAGAFAADESITITTYYPSPYGDYKSLSTTSDTYLATAGGNVGIGATAPDSKLNIEDAAGSNTIGAGVLKISAATDASHEFSFRLDSANKNLNIDKRWGGSGATVLTINRQFGNVGIGTADPTVKLQVAGAIKAGNTTYNCREQEGGQIRVDTNNNLQVCATGQTGWGWRNITYDTTN